jgi:adenosylmethionine---8-amino-7-oxononanoate aminotransferase
MKIAVQFWLNKGITQRCHFLAFKGGYHGDTFATMSVCDPEEGMHGPLRQGLAATNHRGASGRCAVAEKNMGKPLRQQAHEPPRQIERGLMHEPAEHDVRHTRELL